MRSIHDMIFLSLLYYLMPVSGLTFCRCELSYDKEGKSGQNEINEKSNLLVEPKREVVCCVSGHFSFSLVAWELIANS